MRALGTLAAVVIAVVLVAGCGGDDGGGEAADLSPKETVVTYEPPSGLSLEQWQALTTAVCVKYEPQQDFIVGSHPPSSDPADAVAMLDDLIPVAAQYLDALQNVPIPPERHRDVERAYALLDENFEAAYRLRAGAGREDEREMRVALGDLDAASKELSTLLTDLGVPACA